MKAHGEVRLILVAPVPPPAGGIAKWTQAILNEARDWPELSIHHVDTTVRWRSPNNMRLLPRVAGGGLQALRDIKRLFLAIRRFKPSVVHLCTSGSLSLLKDIAMLAMARLSGIKTAVHFRMGRLPEIFKYRSFEARLVATSVRLADVVLVLDTKSELTIKAWMPGVNVMRIPNPIDLSQFSLPAPRYKEAPVHRDGLRIVFAGHVIREKGIIELVQACGQLRPLDLSLLLVGDIEPDFRHQIEESCAGYGDGRWVRILGPRKLEEAIEIVSLGDVLVLPSYTEGFPNVILEGMALGKAIVASRVGAIPEMLGDNSGCPCGLVVNPKDVDSLRDALFDLAVNPRKRADLGRKARRRVEELYSLNRIMQEYVGLWRTLAAS